MTRRLAPDSSSRRVLVRRLLIVFAGISLVLLGVQLLRTVDAATNGEAELRAAKVALEQRDFASARASLNNAQQQFGTARSALRWSGPAGYLGQVVPISRVQFRAARALADAGATAADAGLALVPVVD